MFYSPHILTRTGPLGTVYIAGTYGTDNKALKKPDIVKTDLQKAARARARE